MYEKFPPHLNIVLTLPCENETTHFTLIQCTLRTLPPASSMVWNTKFKYRENNLTCTSYVQNVSSAMNTSMQACWLLVNCIINQRLLQAAPHTCS